MEARAFVLRFRSEILAEWRLLARDTVPGVDDALVEHALDELTGARVADGFGVAAAVKVLTLLRHCMLRVWQRCNPDGDLADLRGLDRAIDDEIEAVVAGIEQARQLEQTQLQSIVKHAPAAIWIKDLQGRIVLANDQLGEALHQDHGKVIGKRSDELLADALANPHQEHDAMVMRENRAIEFEESAPGPDGPRTFLSIKFPIPGDPPLIGGIATEITARKRMEEELRDAVRMREELLAVVSHDLRNPLGSVQLSTSLLMSHAGIDQRARRHLEVISRSCRRMEHLIDDLLDTAMIRAGRFHLDLREENVDDVVAEAIDLQQPISAEKGIVLSRIGNLPGIRIQCDRDRILQVFGNLIGNALKFGRAGDTISVTAEQQGRELRFSVQDTGPGIDADVLPHLFEPYWSAPEHKAQGSGLGLYIVRGIVESHGGRVWAERRDGGGAIVLFTLPLATPG